MRNSPGKPDAICASPSRHLVPYCLVPHGAKNWLTWESPSRPPQDAFADRAKSAPRMLIVTEWRDISLRLLAPMNLHAIGPRLHSIVSSLREPDFVPCICAEADPTPHAG